ncbi:MAG TPA: glycoside hydrolase family 15 protein [Gammaproteobacteria bacterium]
MTEATQQPDLELALIGNCAVSALLNIKADVVWMCVPRFDGDPIFNSLLQQPHPDVAGCFSIVLQNFKHAEQYYEQNTAILNTRLRDSQENCVEITDFMPRFTHHGRPFHPTMLVRRLMPVKGTPLVSIKLRPTYQWGTHNCKKTTGSNHIRYLLDDDSLRLTTDIPLAYIHNESCFVLDRPYTLILGPDETLQDAVAVIGRKFYEETQHYWREWVRNLSIPYEWQDAVIRAAITLKQNSYEDTGAIIAAMTTSIPEAPDTVRNWDYRYCWLRDAYFVVNALNRLSKNQTMEEYLHYIVNVVANASGNKELQPVYSIDGQGRLLETEVNSLAGYRGYKPVRVGNLAYLQKQNDVYGSVILASAHLFFDRRLAHTTGAASRLFHMLEQLGENAYACYDKPDAGLWEFRNTSQVHTYSSVMCWAACDRLVRIARHLQLAERATFWQQRADTIHAVICTSAWNPELQSFTENFGGQHLDASLLLLNELGFLKADDPRFAQTVQAIEKNLRRGNFIYRYTKEDDFGAPATAFTVCTFWYIDALVALKRTAEARKLFEQMLLYRNRLGLLSEDITPDRGELWGNFPQTYSMVGLINAAIRLSTRWEDAF